MSEPRDASELLKIGYKVALLVFTVGQSLSSETSITPWYILSVLLYLSTNLLFYMLKKESFRSLIAVLSIGIAIAMFQDHPLVILLLPAHLYELASTFVCKQGIASSLLMMIPLLLVPRQLILLYILIAAVTLIYFSTLKLYDNKLRGQHSELERMRGDLERVHTRLQENNEFLRQAEYTLKLEERNRLSQDIHDNIGHAMTSALIQMEAAKRLIKINSDQASLLLDNAIHISKEGIESIRFDLKKMKPPTEQMGVNRMKLFIDEFSDKHPIRTAFTYEGNMDFISPIHWKIIQDNMKEAFTNMMKYAGATAVSLHVQVLPTLIKATVTDNGQGKGKIVKGLGIIGMEERAAAVGGTVIVDGSRGFSVTTLIPYTP
ncbi:sensor histidine kinase [Paenibacillus sp. B2(2019)]|uniref:sensor histidine kinase n=1 Tax=Paenibacillus sp. B2(2019) TaxID=2607754 RepID=UPI0011F18568|nr:histidine kinase [Paenibacillus sp. B2(2019)]KAA1183521.1 sensor histidine kinase [Paenibacillus sp. B2(2019)]